MKMAGNRALATWSRFGERERSVRNRRAAALFFPVRSRQTAVPHSSLPGRRMPGSESEMAASLPDARMCRSVGNLSAALVRIRRNGALALSFGCDFIK